MICLSVCLFGLFLSAKFPIFPVESFDSPGRINHLLFTGEKGMALRANFNRDLLAS